MLLGLQNWNIQAKFILEATELILNGSHLKGTSPPSSRTLLTAVFAGSKHTAHHCVCQTPAAGAFTCVTVALWGHGAFLTSKARRLGSFERHHQDSDCCFFVTSISGALPLSGSDKDRTAKKMFNMTTLLLIITSSWPDTEALDLPHLPPRQTLQLLNTLDNFR